MLYINYEEEKRQTPKNLSYKKSLISKDIARAGWRGAESSGWLRRVFEQRTRNGWNPVNAKINRFYIMLAKPAPQKIFIIITKLYKNTTKKCIFI